ncbi:DUF362 domain-containing protein [Halarchaeum sp. P4]|uniref:DUF362 domain-containing protein n=1 Tax=Halarchaeum sp. P4 TaxID=3421639 RepID=UPI003EBE9100
MTVHARRVADADDPPETAIETLLDATAPTLGGRVLVVPDTHHPYHPTTGAVTNPVVLDAVLTHLDAAGHDVRVGVTDARAARFVGVERVAARHDMPVVSLADAPTHTVTPDGASERVAVPAPLVEDSVVALPTLRRDDGGDGSGIAGVGALCARALGHDSRALARTTVSPALAILDATYTLGADAHESGVVAASTDGRALDAIAADALNATPPDGAATPTVEGMAPGALDRAVTDEAPASAATGDVLAACYRAYARFVGDAVPPQFQRDATEGER